MGRAQPEEAACPGLQECSQGLEAGVRGTSISLPDPLQPLSSPALVNRGPGDLEEPQASAPCRLWGASHPTRASPMPSVMGM